MQKFLNLLIQNIEAIIDLLTPIRYCDEGFNMVRKTFGIPNKVFTPGLCYKLPIIQSFDKVNMKMQTHFLNAHSVMAKDDKIIPYNITVDAQVEFRITDPLVIYHIDTFDEGNREPIRIYVDNEVHLIINSVIKEDIKPEELQEKINEKLKNKEPQSYFEQAIKIERIILSAYDYNISIRHAE